MRTRAYSLVELLELAESVYNDPGGYKGLNEHEVYLIKKPLKFLEFNLP